MGCVELFQLTAMPLERRKLWHDPTRTGDGSYHGYLERSRGKAAFAPPRRAVNRTVRRRSSVAASACPRLERKRAPLAQRWYRVRALPGRVEALGLDI